MNGVSWPVVDEIEAEKGGRQRVNAVNGRYRRKCTRKTISGACHLVMFKSFVLFPQAPRLQLLARWRLRLLEWQTGLRRAFVSRKRETGTLEKG